MGWTLTLHAYADHVLLVLRLALAAVFAAHAWPKLVDPAKVVVDSGKPQLAPVFRVIGVAELAGALGLATGLLAALAAAGLVLLMIGAIAVNVVVLRAPFASHAPRRGGWDLPLALLAGALVVFVVGAGRFCFDRLVFGV